MANKEKLLANAQKLLAKGQVSKAIKEYQALIGAFPKDVRNRQKLAELLTRDKRSDEALTEYEAVAKHYAETGFYLKAIAVFKQMQKIDPSRVSIYHRLAELNEKQGLIGNALSEYRNLVDFYDKQGMSWEALEVLEKMLALNPDNLNIAIRVVECCLASGREDAASEKFQEILEPLLARGEHSKVIKLYDHFPAACPEDGTARLPLARALLANGNADKAIQLLKGLLKNSPEDPDIQRCLTDAYLAAGDFANAHLTLKHLLKQRSEDLDLRELYLRICIDAGEVERARDRLVDWQDDFIQAARLPVLQGFCEELACLLAGDPQIVDTLTAIGAASGAQARLDRRPALEEPAPPDQPPGQKRVAEKIAALGTELELDLDLEITPAAESGAPINEPQAIATAGQVEIELELDGMDLLEFDFEDQSAGTDAADGSAEDESELEIAWHEPAGIEPVLATAVEELSLEDEFSLPAQGIIDRVEGLSETETPGGPHEVKGMEALEGFEELEELDELAGLEDFDRCDGGGSQPLTAFGPIAVGSDLNVEAELEEAEFYLQQGLHDDAERVIQALLQDHPDRLELQAKLAEIRQGRHAAQPAAEDAVFVELVTDLQDDDLLAATDFLDSFGGITHTDDELSQKLVSELDSSDTESHYNLGIAYKEMGLYDDAIAEFDKAGKGPSRSIDCLTLIGQCHLEAGDVAAALATFKSGLARPDLNDEARMTLNFELGMLYQSNGQLLDALDFFQQVAARDSFYRDVGEVIKHLRRQLGLDDGDDDGGPQGNRDRVSYV